MKVLHVIPSLGPLRGGPSFALPVMTRGLAAQGVDVHVTTMDDNGPGRLAVPLDIPITENGVTTRYFPRQGRPYTFSWPLTRWMAVHARDYDLIHIHALFSYASTVSSWAGRRAGVPYVVRPLGSLARWGMTHRRPQLKRASFELVERHILSGAAAIHYTSEQEYVEARELGVCARAAIIPLGIDIHEFEGLHSPELFLRQYPTLAGRTIVLFMSRLDPKKGLDLLLPAFAQVLIAHPEAALVIAGDGRDDFLRDRHRDVAALGLHGSVVFTGMLSGELKLSAFAASSLFVLPSYSENFGLAAVEAMAAGLPVILTSQVPISQEVAAAHAGVVTECDTSEIASALDAMLAAPERLQAASVAARTLARSTFSSESATRMLLELYADILGRHQNRGRL